MKKILFTIMALLLFSSTAYGVASNRRYFHIDIVDQWGETITSPAITQVDVQNESGVAVAVYSTKTGTTEVGSTGVITTNIDDGRIEFWYADTAIDLTVTDGTRSYEVESFSVRSARFMLPSFLQATASLTLTQTQNLDFEYGGWVVDGDTTNRLDMIPDNDSAILAIGDGDDQADVYFYHSSTEWMFYDEGNGIFEMVGVNIDLDDASSLGIGTNDDFRVYSDTGNIMEFDPAAAGNSIYFGTSDTDAVNLVWFGDLSGDTVTFDEENLMVEFEDIALAFGDATCTLWGDTIGTGDISVGATGAVLRYRMVAPSTGSITYGSIGDGYDIPIQWAGETPSDYFALTGDNLHLEHIDLCFADGTCALWGNALGTGDISVGITSNVLRYNQVVASTGSINYGSIGDGYDIPIQWAGETPSDYFALTGDNLHLEHIDLCFSDGTCILWGNALGTGDLMVGLSGNVLRYVQVAAGTGSIAYGSSDGTDIPIVWHAETGGNEVTFSGDTVSFDGVDIYMAADNQANIIFEGGTDDGSEITLAANDPSADATFSLPAATTGTFLIPSYTAHTENSSIWATECWGGVVSNHGGSENVMYLDLPGAVAGMQVTFVSGVSASYEVRPGSGDIFHGLCAAANNRITSPGGIGTYHITLRAIDANTWVQISSCGSWGSTS